MSKGAVKELLEENMALREEVEACKKIIAMKKSAMQDPEWVLSRLVKLEGGEKAFNAKKRRLECQMIQNGRFCTQEAVHALPRPVIIVCAEHRAYWNKEIEKAEQARELNIHTDEVLDVTERKKRKNE